MTMHNRKLKDYTVIDFETCGTTAELRKHVTEISAIRVRNGQVEKEFTTLVNPQMCISEFVCAKTGITNAMVENQPTLDAVLPEFLDFIGSDVLLGYNISTFDYPLLCDIADMWLGKSICFDYIDVLTMVQETFPHATNRRLTTICRAFGIGTAGAHRALNDCHMTKLVYDTLFTSYDHAEVADKLEKYGSEPPKHFTLNFSDTTILLRKLESIIKEIVSDNEVTVEEIEKLSGWLQENIALKGNYPFDRVYYVLEDVLEDGIVDKDELSMLLAKFNEFLNPTEANKDVKLIFRDRHFILTGDFDYGPRSMVEEYIKDRDGIIDATVKKCTNYVIVGAGGSEAWSNGNYGTKIKKALELKEKGQKIEIMTEKDFFDAGDGEEEEEISEDESWEQMSLFDNATPWQEVAKKAIDQVNIDEELPENCLLLDTNLSRKGDKVTSYSVFIRKPDYPKGVNTNGDIKTSLLNIQFAGHGNIHLLLPLSSTEIASKYGFEVKKRKSEPFIRVIVTPASANMYELFHDVVKDIVSRYVRRGSDNTFGCCHLYKECSEARKCLHENKLYARGCQYYYNLKAGKIFY